LILSSFSILHYDLAAVSGCMPEQSRMEENKEMRRLSIILGVWRKAHDPAKVEG